MNADCHILQKPSSSMLDGEIWWCGNFWQVCFVCWAVYDISHFENNVVAIDDYQPGLNLIVQEAI